MNIIANVSQMFMHIKPWDCSNSEANLGPNAARLTWSNALRVAENHAQWLESPLADAAEGMRDWARDTGAWERDEIAAWDETHCLALFVQNIASELRICLDADERTLHDCAALYEQTDWDGSGEYPIGHYYVPGPKAPFADVRVSYYTGS